MPFLYGWWGFVGFLCLKIKFLNNMTNIDNNQIGQIFYYILIFWDSVLPRWIVLTFNN